MKKRGPKKGTTQKIHTRKYKSGKVKTIINNPKRKSKR